MVQVKAVSAETAQLKQRVRHPDFDHASMSLVELLHKVDFLQVAPTATRSVLTRLCSVNLFRWLFCNRNAVGFSCPLLPCVLSFVLPFVLAFVLHCCPMFFSVLSNVLPYVLPYVLPNVSSQMLSDVGCVLAFVLPYVCYPM